MFDRLHICKYSASVAPADVPGASPVIFNVMYGLPAELMLCVPSRFNAAEKPIRYRHFIHTGGRQAYRGHDEHPVSGTLFTGVHLTSIETNNQFTESMTG